MFKQENPGAKAALLSGPPGIGKTTLATLVASEMGYEVYFIHMVPNYNQNVVKY
jgi:replication factor C subunit 1